MHSFSKDPLFAYEDAVAAMQAMSALIGHMMDTGDDHASISYGVSVIFDQQLETLSKARELVSAAAKAQWSVEDIGIAPARSIAPAGFNMVLVTEPDGKRYMTTPALAGVSEGGATRPRFEDESPADIRKRVIAELIGDGKVAGEIAQAMNIKKTLVEQVIGQLLGEKREQDAQSNSSSTVKAAVNQ